MFFFRSPKLSYDDQRQTQLFVKDQIPTWLTIGGYIAIAVVSTTTLPHIFHQLNWHHIIVIYIFAPVLAFCNAFGCGLTDWSLASAYGNLAIFTIGAWIGASHEGVLAGLAACGVMMNIVSTASDLTASFQDRLHDIGFSSFHVCEPSDWHCNGMCDIPMCILDLLQGFP
ncbi:putative metal-nicotianamine transporter YSL5 [Forsythia ovata]|uniref:Metal-nicotianamine transporter YSL5 n=1 Tax=Forsythia ovata TaxID=205694 RepID=A0ABD1QSE0_9LAMI